MEKLPKEVDEDQKYHSWAGKMRYKWACIVNTFGSNTLMILFFVYWSQGFRAMSFLSITLHFKNAIKLDPAWTQFIVTMTFMTWLFKPIYGIITDNFKFFGYYRKSYLFAAGVLGSISVFSIFFFQNLYFSVFALILNEFSQAFCDVIADAIMVEKSRNDESGSSTLQSFSWTVVAIAGIIGSILGGLLLETYSPQVIIASSAICPLLLVYCSTQFEESPPTNDKGIKENCKLLWESIKKPEILRPSIFILILGTASPRYPELWTYYFTDVSQFSPIFISSLNIISYSSYMFGSIIYYNYLSEISYRKIILTGQILLLIFNITDFGIINGVHEVINVPAWAYVYWDEAFTDIIWFIFNSLPLLVLSAKICPVGVEATFFALITSIDSFSGIFGGFLISTFDVKTGQYELFWVLILIQCFTKFIPLLFLSLLPPEENQSSKDKENSDIEMEPLTVDN